MLTVGIIVALAALALYAMNSKSKSVLPWIGIAWTLAWTVVASKQPDLWPVAALGFVQNVAFTFVSRGRNSGSLMYHLIAAIFSNGLYAALLFVSIDQVAQAKANPTNFLVVYTLSTLAGSIFAHWLALRLEKGKAKQVNDSSLDYLRRRIAALESQSRVGTVSSAVMPSISHGPFTEGYSEIMLADGTQVRFWLPDEDSDVQSLMQRLAQDARNSVSESSADLAKRLAEDSGANAVQVTRGTPTCRIGAVHYRVWP